MRFREEAHAEAARFGTWAELRSTGDSIAALRSHAEEIRQRHLNRLRHRARMDADRSTESAWRGSYPAAWIP